MNHLAPLLDATVDVPTPFLVFDDDVVRDNIQRVQQMCDRAGVALRPHIKTHKSVEVARSQLEAGAVGVTCATASEAVALGRAGLATDVLIAVPVFVDTPKRDLIRDAATLHESLSVTVDSIEVARSVMHMLDGSVGVFVEIDSGQHRTGATPTDGAGLARSLGTRFRGFITHGGHGYEPGRSEEAGYEEAQALSSAVQAYGRETVSSAGSTPTLSSTLAAPISEVRPGTYVYGDHQQVLLGSMHSDQIAGGVVATVIHAERDRYVIDAGAKALSKDRPEWIDSYGFIVGDPAGRIVALNDNHGMVQSRAETVVGMRTLVVPNHICPVVDLFDGCWKVGIDAAFSRTELRGCHT